MSLALPRLDNSAATATRVAVAAGLNGVDPELRGHAIGKIKAALRRGTVPPDRVQRAIKAGDQGLASLFPVDLLPPAPMLSAANASPQDGLSELANVALQSRWFIELAFRRRCAPEGLVEALADPGGRPARTASLLLQTWNNLLESYRPDWLPEQVEAERPLLFAVPATLLDENPYDYHRERGLIRIESRLISRLFVDAEIKDFDVLLHALQTLDEACRYPVMAVDPIGGRQCYFEYGSYEFREDLKAHLTWPEGATEPVADHEAVELLLENFGFDPTDADYMIEQAIAEAVFCKRWELAPDPDALSRKLSDGDSPAITAAREILNMTQRLADIPVGRRKMPVGHCGIGLPAHLLATWGDDKSYADLQASIDMDCQEEVPAIELFRDGISMPELDRQMSRLVAEMLVCEITYGLVFEVS